MQQRGTLERRPVAWRVGLPEGESAEVEASGEGDGGGQGVGKYREVLGEELEAGTPVFREC